jgi:hypothetical protein
MSINSAVSFDMDVDMTPQMNEYPSFGSEYVPLEDTNQFNYLNNWINFNTESLQGKSVDDLLRLSGGFVTIPHTTYARVQDGFFGKCTATVTNAAGARTMAAAGENAFAVGLKNSMPPY